MISMSRSPTVLLRGGSVYAPGVSRANAMLTVGDTIAWVGSDEAATHQAHQADRVVELRGRLVTPGFVDAHAHLASTGFALQSLDLSGAASLVDALRLLETAGATQPGPVVFAHGWDETGWPERRAPTGAEVDRAVGNRVAYLSRVDAHSAVVSSSLLDRRPSLTHLEGWRGDGGVERDAHHAARGVVDDLRTAGERKHALSAALRQAASRGITSVHELNAPHIAPFSDFAVIRELADESVVPEVVPYWGAALTEGDGEGAGFEQDGGVVGFAGDFCADGAIGSRTAALSQPYADADTTGHLYLDRDQVRRHVVACTERHRQAGFHVIGDRALHEVIRGFVAAADTLGEASLVAARHRLEHVEMPNEEAIAHLARLGIVASVQPAFDAAWGAAGQLYEQRLGPTRAQPMNPFGSMQAAGVTLAFGSDSPVTPLDPWGAVRAAMQHHAPEERLTVAAAFSAHTQGGHRARGDDAAGVLSPGSRASYAVWDVATSPGALPDLAAGTPRCLLTVVSGTTAFYAGDLS